MSDPKANEVHRLGIISDIHGNWEALEAVLNALDREGVDQIVCCGDVVGYGASPNECVTALMERDIPTVLGNHDAAVLSDDEVAFFNEMAREAVLWTREILGPEQSEWLAERPMTLRTDKVLFVHASPKEPRNWNYVVFYGDAREAFDNFTERLCFIGHSHQPFFISLDGEEVKHHQTGEITVKSGQRYLVNVGSVGQPRDRDPRAAFVIADFDEKTIRLHRAEYDIEAAQEKIRTFSSHAQLSQRLATGS